MKIILSVLLVLTPVIFVSCALNVQETRNEILEHVNEVKKLIEQLETDESDREEEIRTTGAWVPWNSSNKGLPVGFVIGGTDDNGWYGVVIRANYSDNLIPGKYNPDAHTAFVSFEGTDHGVNDDFEILTHSNYVWSKGGGTTDDSLIEGGYENGQKTYICKTRHNGEWVCGKLFENVCKVPWGGKEYVYEDWIALHLRD